MAILFTSCSSKAPVQRDSQARVSPNVILITIDTLRADHLGCYGYGRNTSPRMDAFATQATLYERCRATAPWTIPTHGSLFTGKLPFEHGAHSVKVTKPVNNVRPLPLENRTLAEVFKNEGYETGAFVANSGYLMARMQFNQGFDTYHVKRSYAKVLNNVIFDWLSARANKRFFLFINYIDTHRPYNTTPRPHLLDRPAVQDKGRLLNSLYAKVMPGRGHIPENLVRQVIDQYDTAVANVDEQIGVLLDRLDQMGLRDNTLIVLTSDHGEYFGEHYLVEHSKDVYEEALWVPLMIRNPGQRTGTTVETLISSTDVPHLILSQFPGDVAGRYDAVFPDAPGNHVVISENYYTRTKDLFNKAWGHRFDRIRTVVYDWPHKFIQSSDDQHELYDLAIDPTESNNLIDSEPEIAERLANRLKGVQSRRPRWETQSAPPALSEEQRKQLKSLGYIGD